MMTGPPVSSVSTLIRSRTAFSPEIRESFDTLRGQKSVDLTEYPLRVKNT